MSTPDRYTLLARKAVAEVNKFQPQFVSLLMNGKLDHNWEMKVARKAIELALDELVKPEHIQTMLATGKDGDQIAKSKDGGLTWSYVLYEKHRAELLGGVSTKPQTDP